ncbi:bile acid-CoA:amino acid N-acyltransferase-like [Notolabrus celidotus]|uniref:bile acid-CoA:amino acid N-acyltransferase-like n=1 Tax=Notolabrus celidotus TaxID=1203425 RepID=UPI00148FF9A8|nr:bile acid-CoA:amino acid N-acyltransferase-like [Notolabrus celidotus]
MCHIAHLQHAMGGVHWMSSSRPAPLLTASPVRALIDEQINIEGCFLSPNCPVTVCAQMHSEDGDLWESFAHYVAKADGTISLTRDESVGGSYLGCEPMGLLWSLQPAPGGRLGLRLRKKNVETPYVVHMSLLEGHVSPSKSQSTWLAAVTAERWYMAPGVQRIEIRQDGLVGTLFLPPGQGQFSAMLDLWGLGGGLVEYRSALFASKGYASLSLAYVVHEDLPGPKKRVNIGDSYFKAAFQLFKIIIKSVPTELGSSGSALESYPRWRRVEDVECPLLYVLGEDDQSVPNKENADLVEVTLNAAGKSHLFTRLPYPGAGHLIEPPYAPNARRPLYKVEPNKLFAHFGGHHALHAAAQEDCWRKMLAFMESHLR